jgi:hypothetical protein
VEKEGRKKDKIKYKNPQKVTRRTANKERMVNPFDSGLPSIISAVIAPEVYEKQDTVDDGEGDTIKVNPGTFICQRLAFGMEKALEIKPNNADWLDARHTCLFQISLDDNADDVMLWLEEQPIVLAVEGNSSLDYRGMDMSGEYQDPRLPPKPPKQKRDRSEL